MKLLIVDDEAEILDLLRRNLELEDYEVTITTSPLTALRLMQENLYNLVLTDIKMPEMTGVELLKELKRINPMVNVIIMTGFSNMSHVVDCLGSGAVDYFVKPFNELDQLLSAVHQARDRLTRWRFAMGLE